MKIRQSELIYVKDVPGKGRGVFARKAIAKGTMIERVPILKLPASDIYNDTQNSKLADYVFKWGKKTVMVALGYGSIYNHSYKPNAHYYDDGPDIQIYEAVKKIKKGEEITINYNGKPSSKRSVSFDVVES